MSHCCSQCNFTAQFESALLMHRQLHHEAPAGRLPEQTKHKSGTIGATSVPLTTVFHEKSKTLPRATNLEASYSGSSNETKGIKLPGRTSSATRLFEKLRSRIVRTRSRSLFSHPEENSDTTLMHDLSGASLTSSALDSALKGVGLVCTTDEPAKGTFACHLCSFVADRITVLDRHLLNDHKIGLENLLKLVMAKTKDGLADDNVTNYIYGINEPYYKPVNEIFEEGEFVIETVVPKIKVLKHTATNTELIWSDIPDLKDNCRKITRELEKLVKYPEEKYDKDDLMMKMQTLSECMCKFVDSTKTLKKVLAKEYDSRTSVRERLSSVEPFLEMGLGDQDTSREWERAHSDKMERSRHKHDDNSRGGKSKISSESFYF